MDWLKNLLNQTPELALFASLAIGYAIGRIRIWKIQLGGICGTLLAALLIGQLGVTLNDEVKNLAFALFIFALGYTAGPQFFANLNRKGLRYFGFPVIEIVCVVGITCIAVVTLGLDQGTAAGLLGGGATESAVVGTATEAIGKLDLPAGQIATLQANVGTAYTISYLCGLVTIVLFTSQIAPVLMRINLREEAAKLLDRLGGREDDPDAGEAPALPALVGRAHEVNGSAGRTVADIEQAMGGATVERVTRGDQSLTVTPETQLRAGDVVLLVGERRAVLDGDTVIGPEVAGGDNFDLELDSRDVVFTKRDLSHRPLGDLEARIEPDVRHGVFLSAVMRMGHRLPLRSGTMVQTGDVIRLTGRSKDVDRVAGRIGFTIDPAVKADFVYLGLGLMVGVLVGKLSLTVGDVPLSLGTGGGALLAGLVFGWLRAKHPTFGAFHPAAAQVVKDFGLATFIACVGLASGPQAIALVRQYGVALPIAGILITLIPAVISFLIGWKLLKLDAPILLGCVAGQQCSTPAISAIQQAAGNSTPLIGYTIVYALSNVLLPLLGPVIVGLSGSLA